MIAVAVHGGAQNKRREELSPDRERLSHAGVQYAIDVAWNILASGGSAVDAVEAAVSTLENGGVFNAGKGSAVGREGIIEMDAAIMDGRTLAAGAVAVVRHIKNPVRLARRIMERGPHVFLSGQGAEDFARGVEIETVGDDYFVRRQEKSEQKRDTVGAVALDIEGNLAAATSTGGLTGKLPGRIGDSPIIGGGTYARNGVCAVSCTGEGELIMRGVYAHEIASLMHHAGLSLRDACAAVLGENAVTLRAEMGIIGVDSEGHVEMVYNTLPMFRGFRTSTRSGFTAVWE